MEDSMVEEKKWQTQVKKREKAEEEEEERGEIWKGKERPKGRQKKRAEKVGEDEKCRKERVQSQGNSSGCPSTLHLLQVNSFCSPFWMHTALLFHCFFWEDYPPFLYG